MLILDNVLYLYIHSARTFKLIGNTPYFKIYISDKFSKNTKIISRETFQFYTIQTNHI